MNHTTTEIDLGNNEQLFKGINKNNDGTYTAMTFSKSKNFKTLKGAQKWMEMNTQK
jgi:ribosomal protein S6